MQPESWLCERQEELGQEERALLLDLPTRWNLTYTMVSHLVEEVILKAIMSSMSIHGVQFAGATDNSTSKSKVFEPGGKFYLNANRL